MILSQPQGQEGNAVVLVQEEEFLYVTKCNSIMLAIVTFASKKSFEPITSGDLEARAVEAHAHENLWHKYVLH